MHDWALLLCLCDVLLWPVPVGVNDTFWLFILRWIRQKNDSIQYSIQSWIKNIHSNWKNNLSLRKQGKTCKMGRFFPLKTHFYSYFLQIMHFLIHSKIHSIVRQKYSFKEFIHSIVWQKYSFKEFIHSKNNLIIHSMKIFIFLKNAVSATPMVVVVG